MTQPTSKKLADALAAEPCAPEHEARRDIMVQGALHDHYHDYFGHSASPCVDLNRDCEAIGLTGLAARVRDGEFDASSEEAEAWAKSGEGQDTFAKLIGEPRTAPDGPICEAPPVATLGDAPIEETYRQMMGMLAAMVDGLLNGEAKGADRKNGFVLLVFPFGNDDGRCNYISNGADRKDIVLMMREQIKQFEGQPEVAEGA